MEKYYMKWEYLVFSTEEMSTICQLDIMGEKGWELVSATDKKLYFKREYFSNDGKDQSICGDCVLRTCAIHAKNPY
jgi:hypothetical protein